MRTRRPFPAIPSGHGLSVNEPIARDSAALLADLSEQHATRIGEASRSFSTVVLIDVAGSARHSANGQRKMRDDLYGLVDDVLAYWGTSLDALPFNDNGDGLRLMIPFERIQSTQVIDMFVLGLGAGLREHRRYASDAYRIRLRLAFDRGEVEQHLRGWAGAPLVQVARLIEADQAREALRTDSRLDLVAVVSNDLYEAAVRHGRGYVDPGCYRPIRVRVKEFDAPAWLVAPSTASVCSGSCQRLAA